MNWNIGVPGDWVIIPSDSELERIPQPEHGLRYWSMQARAGAAEEERFTEFVFRADSFSDIKNYFPVNIDFNPEYESFVFHTLAVSRDGKTRDIIGELEFRELQREQQLEESIFTGRRSLHADVNDLQIGDVIRFSFTVLDKNPLFHDHVEFKFPLASLQPVGRLLHRLDVAGSVGLHFQGHNTEAAFARSEANGRAMYTLALDNVAPLYIEEGIPCWEDPFPKITVSDFGSWEEFGKRMCRYYLLPDHHSPELEAVLEEIRQGADGPEQLLTGAIRYVNNKIRYHGIELKENAYTPHDPSLVVERKFGDCKDKAQLLRYLLDRLGIPSHIMLVSALHRYNLINLLPGLSSLDHAILAIEFGGETIIHDPTILGQLFSLANRSEIDYGYGYILKEGNRELTKFECPKNNLHQLEVVETFSFDAGGDAEMKVVTEARYHTATAFSNMVKEERPDIREKNNEQMYSGIYPEIKSAGPPVDEIFPEENMVRSTQQFTIHGVWRNDHDESGRDSALFGGLEMAAYLQHPAGKRRQYNLLVGHPIQVVKRVVLEKTGLWPIDNEQFALDNDFFSFKIEAVDSAAEYVRTWEYRSKCEVIPAEQYPEFCKAVKQAGDRLVIALYKPGQVKEGSWGKALLQAFFALALLSYLLRHVF